MEHAYAMEPTSDPMLAPKPTLLSALDDLLPTLQIDENDDVFELGYPSVQKIEATLDFAPDESLNDLLELISRDTQDPSSWAFIPTSPSDDFLRSLRP